ncbi:MAG: xanthine dehydrogenase accessory protein XdhC [Deltaproteobacteria bacterium]|nr:xanthine dehydrogenase accessory protein XdhC [Deltaproteobacteria bacterium]
MEPVYRAILELLDHGHRGVLCTVVESAGSAPQRAGSKLLLREDGTMEGTVGGGAIEDATLARAREVLASGRPERFAAHLTRELAMCCGGRMEIFIEPIGARPWLIVFGGGHVASALIPVAATAGFRVHVVDQREQWATEVQHPSAEARTCADPLDVLQDLPWSPEAYAVIVTHDHQLDERIVERCLAHPWRYLGMIGSRAKAHRIIGRLAAKGADSERLGQVVSPIGLGIGGREPGEIAVSVVAELIAVRRNSEGTMPLNIVPSVLDRADPSK